MRYLTFLNAGCIELCRNMLKSAQQVGIDVQRQFTIGCFDTKAYDTMRNMCTDVRMIDGNHPSEYQRWSAEDGGPFRNIVMHKWPFIGQVYAEDTDSSSLVWVDTDVVFLRSIEAFDGHAKTLIQSDLPGNDLCSGFMIFNRTQETRDLIERCAGLHTSDQQMLNEVYVTVPRFKASIEILDRALFPNGHMYYQKRNRRPDAYIVHNNWMFGKEEKKKQFRKARLWFI